MNTPLAPSPSLAAVRNYPHVFTFTRPSFFREPRKINLSQGPASERLSAVMGDLASIDDAFDAALNLEESHIDDGWEDGLR